MLVVREGMEADVREARRRPDRSPRPGGLRGAGQHAAGRIHAAARPHEALGHRPRDARRRAAPGRPVRGDQRRRLLRPSGSYRVLAEHLRRPQDGPVPEFAIVGFPLRDHAEPGRPREPRRLHRGRRVASRLDPRGAEGRAGRRGRAGARRVRRLAAASPAATPVSLNFWGFTPALLPALEDGFRRFLAANAASPKAEYFLLSAVQALVDAGARPRARPRRAAARGAGSPTPGTGRASSRCSSR